MATLKLMNEKLYLTAADADNIEFYLKELSVGSIT